MPAEVMSAYDRSRILQLALKKSTVQQIGDRLGFSYDRVRRIIERAEKKGDVPAGTLKGCGVLVRKPSPKKAKAPEIRIYAPARSHAAALGNCSVCSNPTEVALEIGDLKAKLCKTHAPTVSAGVELALMDAAQIRKETTILPRTR